MSNRAGELFIPLSSTTDLAHGNPIGTTRELADLSLVLAKQLGLGVSDQLTTFYTSLLRFIGCTGFASEEAFLFKGDDIDFKKKFDLADSQDNANNLKMLFGSLKRDPIHLLKSVFSMQNFYANLVASDCETASFLAAQMNLPPDTVLALSQIHDRFDGKGKYKTNRKEEIHVAIRILQVMHLFLLSYKSQGKDFALLMLKKREKGHLDPTLCALVKKNISLFVECIEDHKCRERLESFSKMHEGMKKEEEIEKIFESFASVVDLKSRYTNQHSYRMANVAAAAGHQLGYSATQLNHLKKACLCHNLGIANVPTGILEKQGPLTEAEFHQLKLHPYFTNLILANHPIFQPFLSSAIHHHERTNGKGYYKGIDERSFSEQDQLVMLADRYIALQSNRSYRRPFLLKESQAILKKEFYEEKGNLRLVESIFGSAQSAKSKKKTNRFSLTEREIQIISKLGNGLKRKEIANSLGISDRTVQHHLSHIYDKTGLTSRAGLILLANDSGWIEKE